MYRVTKKRAKALLIDSVIAATVSLGAELLLKKRIKSPFFHQIVSPSLVFWGLEYAQLRVNGQTVGQKAIGIALKDEAGGELSAEQILKHIVHRDTTSAFMYVKNRARYDSYKGEKYPHDLYAHTVVKEVD
ncbi:RDD family protein [Planococcus faecalis]|uniref:RDD family protein n=1 Tax=Planococcus faecalis TaxID=1598147 RepID=A0ABM6IW78_9BACL|nr:RDD family protein [Planococcus faecalis]AQU80658.1 RDD family protein [Planococcus faecalis]OHX55658.1 RDD family protein [Planococcus faecalis]